MNRVLRPAQFFALPDGTRVAPVLNPWDANACDLGEIPLSGASVAVGEIPSGGSSKPHLHPIVSQVTWVLEGALRIRMKGPQDPSGYELAAPAGSGVLTEPMTFFQLVNADSARTARVLYIVTPAYVYLPGEGGYEDAVALEQSWEQLAAAGFPTNQVGDLQALRRRRAAAVARMAERRG
jgi:glyoxylate utilization-related uncharacterized protein